MKKFSKISRAILITAMALLASVSMMTPSYAAYVQSTPLTRLVY